VDVGLTGGVTVTVWNIGYFKTLVYFYQTWQCHIPEDCNFDTDMQQPQFVHRTYF